MLKKIISLCIVVLCMTGCPLLHDILDDNNPPPKHKKHDDRHDGYGDDDRHDNHRNDRR